VRYDNLEKIARVPVPLLILHSREDELVPYAHAERLLAAASPPKELVTTGGSHNEALFFARPEWTAAVASFVERTLQRKGTR
jgi:fermentation-respiration switch protein FrsA (DUF1100 family)